MAASMISFDNCGIALLSRCDLKPVWHKHKVDQLSRDARNFYR
jgi:hypothetical protein